MDWQRAIERNQDALLRLVAMLFAQAGLTQDTQPTTIARPLYMSILRVLGPAESAVRRLIIIVARDLKLRHGAKKRPLPDFTKLKQSAATRLPQFRLYDQQKRFLQKDNHSQKFFPRISVLGFSDPTLPEPQNKQTVDPMISAQKICNRLKAVQHALNTMPAQARRMARFQAKRKAAPAGPKHMPPLRVGLPPYFRRQPIEEVDHILAECSIWARWALEPPSP